MRLFNSARLGAVMIFVISSQHNLPPSNHEVLLASTLAASNGIHCSKCECFTSTHVSRRRCHFKPAGKVFHDAIIQCSSSKCTGRLRAQSLGYSPRPSMSLLAKIDHYPWRPTTTRSLYNGPHNPSFRARNAIGTERRPRREDPPPPPNP